MSGRQRQCGLTRLDRCCLEAELEHRFDVAIASAVEVRSRECSRTRPLEPRRAVAITEPNHAEHRAVGKLRTRMPTQHALDDLRDTRSERCRPRDEPRRRPLAVLAMRVWPVLFIGHCAAFRPVAPRMRGNALTAREDLDHRLSRAHFHARTDEGDRHAVETMIESDVVVDVHLGAGPHAELVTTRG